MHLHFTDQNFEEEVVKASQTTPILVDFHADWCVPCRMMDPVLDDLEKEHTGKIVIGSLDVDANPQTAAKFGVLSIPTLIFFKNGEPVKQLVGFQPKENLAKEIGGILSS